MEQVLQLSHGGWSDTEKNQLFEEIKRAAQTGSPLRCVFEKMGERLGRKPNSVRNYYYMQLRSKAPEAPRAAPFETFTDEEEEMLLRAVLSAKAQGQSVRACGMQLSGGDRAKMLRYQNKYRSILRKRPEKIRAMCETLIREGVPAVDVTQSRGENAVRPRVEAKLTALDPDGVKLYQALERLIDRASENGRGTADKLRVERDIALLRLEDMTRAANDMVLLCKEYLGLTDEEKGANRDAFLDELTHHIAQVENAGGEF